jgi:citrate lyase subunit beta/citryl-CoA lyase
MRSYLLVPGADVDGLTRAVASGADAVVAELSDETRLEPLKDWLAADPGHPVWVRLRPGEQGQHDARVVVTPALAGVCLPETRSASELAALASVLAEAEEAQGMPVGRIKVTPVLDSARAVLGAAEIARAPRVTRIQLGEARLTAELGLELGPDERELHWMRSMVVLAAAAAGVESPVGDVANRPEQLRESSLALRRLGFRGRLCTDAAHLGVLHEVFHDG